MKIFVWKQNLKHFRVLSYQGWWKKREEAGMGKGNSWIVKQGWQISGQTDRELSEVPWTAPHWARTAGPLHARFAQLPGSCWGKWCDFGWFSVSVSDREGDDYRWLSTDGAPYAWVATFLRKEFGSSFTILVTVPSSISIHPKSSSYRILTAVFLRKKWWSFWLLGNRELKICAFSDSDRNKCAVEQGLLRAQTVVTESMKSPKASPGVKINEATLSTSWFLNLMCSSYSVTLCHIPFLFQCILEKVLCT